MLKNELVIARSSRIWIKLLMNEVNLLQRLSRLLVSYHCVYFPACLEYLSSKFFLIIDPDPVINVVRYLWFEASGHLQFSESLELEDLLVFLCLWLAAEKLRIMSGVSHFPEFLLGVSVVES